tara:strand:- start:3004 stop:3825 length:822 start_codon:yes stop_codon:yes gene_type:complete
MSKGVNEKSIIDDFMEIHNKFNKSLNKEEIYLLRNLIDGNLFFIIYSKFEEKTLTLENIQDAISYSMELANKMKINLEFPPYYFQIKEYVEDITIENYEELIKTITFKKWIKILTLFKTKILKLFEKAPKTTKEIILTRGTTLDYIGQTSDKSYYKLNRFTSTTLEPYEALFFADFGHTNYGYSDESYGRNNVIYKITVEKGIPLIFINPFQYETNLSDQMEVLLPINSLLYIERGINKIKFPINGPNSMKSPCVPIHKYKDINILNMRLISF